MIRTIFNQNLSEKLEINSAEQHSAELMLRLLENAPKTIRPITNHLATASGKAVRTRLLLASAMDENGLVPQDTIRAATAIELFHLATLVHDDIIDEADSRRGITSLHVKFSKKEAVICGDYLMCMALSTVSTIHKKYDDFIEKFSLSIGRVCLGELRQHSNSNNVYMSFNEYLRTIHGKTAALFHIAAYAGALIGGSSDVEMKQIGKLGTYTGMIFQIVDDCKDYMLNESEALKPTKADIISGVINLPLLMAFIKEPSLREVTKNAIGNKMELGQVVNDVYRLNGVKDSLNVVERYAKKINGILNNIDNKAKVNGLQEIITMQLNIARNFAD